MEIAHKSAWLSGGHRLHAVVVKHPLPFRRSERRKLGDGQRLHLP